MITHCRIEWLLSTLIEIDYTNLKIPYHIMTCHVMVVIYIDIIYIYPCLVHFSVAWAVRTNVKSDQQRIITLSSLWRRAHKWRWHLILRVARPVYTSKKLLLLLLFCYSLDEWVWSLKSFTGQGKSVSLCLKMRFQERKSYHFRS